MKYGRYIISQLAINMQNTEYRLGPSCYKKATESRKVEEKRTAILMGAGCDTIRTATAVEERPANDPSLHGDRAKMVTICYLKIKCSAGQDSKAVALYGRWSMAGG